ncbi:bifunctional acetate--CoA ligase family protein/GNAT family N-acetyltransferase [Verrucomicrobiota bacterium sgz303538]
MKKSAHPTASSRRRKHLLRRHPLQTVFAPQSVALIGATEEPGSVGRTIFENLRTGGVDGVIFPVNPHRTKVLGSKAYKSISAVPEPVDLAIIATPAETVPEIIEQCASAGVAGAVIISAGFRECGAAGADLERQIQARRQRMRIIGPNCLGVMIPHLGLNATFAANMALQGHVGFLSQSGALCTAVLDWSLREKVGFSAFISVGSMLDVGWGDLIFHLGDDPYTKSIVIYMESVGDAHAFLSAAREVALVKPIIVIKVGRTAPASKAAASHTGAMTGNDAVLDAAFQRVGVLRVNTVGQLFAMAEVLGKQPRPAGPRLAIITNAGGPGGLATDMLIATGAQLAPLSTETISALDQQLPPHWSHNNPVDILGDADAERYARSAGIIFHDPSVDGVLVILTPQAMTDAKATAEQLTQYARIPGKPLLASWMGGPAIEAGEEILNRSGIPTFRDPDSAAEAFADMWRYSYHLNSLYETPSLAPESEETAARFAQAEAIIARARKAKHTLLPEADSKKILAAYEIPTVPTFVATTEEDAVSAAEELGYPVVLKLHSRTIAHKSDVGGVQLNLCGPSAVRTAWSDIQKAVPSLDDFLGVTVQPMVMQQGIELILGSSIDPQFGPVLLFGAGGHMVEILKDTVLGLPPLTATLARRMMEQTRIFAALKGIRGDRPLDIAALEQLLVRFSHLVAEQRMIREIDINPLLATPGGFMALDARIVLHDPEIPEEQLPFPAIRPYPTHYITHWKLKNGTSVTIRPIRPEDEPLMIRFHETLSERTVHFRYMSILTFQERVAHKRLARICFNDYDREIPLVAEQRSPTTHDREIIGVGRLSKLHGVPEAEFAIVIGDQWQGLGLGTQFLKRIVSIGRKEKLTRIIAHMLPDNYAMQHIARKLGFVLHHDPAADEVEAELRL